MKPSIEQIAKVCHEANRALCQAFGDNSQPAWADAPDWQKASARAGVEFCIAHPLAPPSANHDVWMKQKLEEGWVYGPIKDPDQKQHPCIVPYEQLPRDQQAKDHIFRAIVYALA